MDIIYQGKKPRLDLPYFGKQARFFEFFKHCITPYLPVDGIYAETNSGSVNNAFEFARMGYRVIVNDIGEYSNAIANAIFVNPSPIDAGCKCKYDWLEAYKTSYIDRASIFAGNMAVNGYNAPMPECPDRRVKVKALEYKRELQTVRNQGVFAYRIYNEDLYKYLAELEASKIMVDVMFMDFAWPWRNGDETEEYLTAASSLSGIFNGRAVKVEMWNKDNVIDKVLLALKMAGRVSKYVFLSTQSSNFPSPELLEVALLENGFGYEQRHTMLTKATEEDNLLKEGFFREYLYVIKS